jgi:SAM-dependent methyltransferase
VPLRSLLSLAASGFLRPLARLGRLSTPLYRLSFLAGASSGHVLRLLRDEGPLPLDAVAARLAPGAASRDALEAWLAFGVHLGELGLDERGYRLKGSLARALAQPRLDPVAALLEEVATLHALILLRTPERLGQGRLFTLDDQDGRMIARSSRILEPLVAGAVDAFVPRRGPVRLLEIGCGSGTHIRRAAARNPELTALGLELQPAVAATARANLQAWGLSDRATVETIDVRDAPPGEPFDLATLHNNVYYFPVAERVALLRRVRAMVRPGGALLVTTGCQGGSLAMDALNLWAAATDGCGRLPSPAELVAQLEEAGWSSVALRRLLPGESYFAFTART